MTRPLEEIGTAGKTIMNFPFSFPIVHLGELANRDFAGSATPNEYTR
jgi:hypothetical protein